MVASNHLNLIGIEQQIGLCHPIYDKSTTKVQYRNNCIPPMDN